MAQNFSKSFYNSKLWKKCRQAYIKSVHGMCERCGEPGLILHHKILLTADNITNPDVTLNRDNLEYVCLRCHNMDENNDHGFHKDNIEYTKYRISSDGQILPP